MAGDDFFSMDIEPAIMLVSKVSELIRKVDSLLISTYNACIDNVNKMPMTREEFNATTKRATAISVMDRLGGGGINSALAASSLGHQNSVFAGFMGAGEKMMADKKITELGIRLGLAGLECETKVNLIFEFSDNKEFIVRRQRNMPLNTMSLVSRTIKNYISDSLTPKDFIMLQSFDYADILPLLSGGASFFLDTGYNEEKRNGRRLTAMLDMARGFKPAGEVMLASNDSEMKEIAKELNIDQKDILNRGKAITDALCAGAGFEILYFVHTQKKNVVFEPGKEPEIVPSFWLGMPKRKINGGDVQAAAIVAARQATGDWSTAAGFGNIAATEFLGQDKFPNRENMAQFLRARTQGVANCTQAGKVVHYSELLQRVNRPKLAAVR